MEDKFWDVMATTRSIKDTIGQTKPFESMAQEVFLTLVRTTELVSDHATSPIRVSGLTVQQYNVLRILRGAGETGLQTYQVAERMVTRAPNITRLVDKLETKTLLTRTRSVTDRRVVTLQITRQGLALLKKLDRPQLDALQSAMRGLSASEGATLCDLLNRLRAPLEG